MTMSEVQKRTTGKLLLTGYVGGLLVKEIANGSRGLLKIQAVRSVVDADDNALPRLEIDLPSGTYTLSVIDNGDLIEEDPE